MSPLERAWLGALALYVATWVVLAALIWAMHLLGWA